VTEKGVFSKLFDTTMGCDQFRHVFTLCGVWSWQQCLWIHSSLKIHFSALAWCSFYFIRRMQGSEHCCQLCS